MSIISIYPSHDSSISYKDHNGNYRSFEIERITKERYYRLYNKDNYKEVYDKLKEIIKKESNIDKFNICAYIQLPETHRNYLKEIFDVETFKFVGHHISHAASAFYQSSFKEALIISFDGGGYEGGEGRDSVSFFDAFIGNKAEFPSVKRIGKYNLDLGTAYGLLSLPISEIKKSDPWQDKFLGYAGKKMGLAAYGKIRNEWLLGLRKFYRKKTRHFNIDIDFQDLRRDLDIDIGLDYFSGQDSYDFAASSQHIFEAIAMDKIVSLHKKYKYLPICLTGGCALNVILNQKLNNFISVDLFIPPNPSDCGLSFGSLCYIEPPIHQVNLTYSGPSILDKEKLNEFVDKYNAKKASLDYISNLLSNGKLIGVIRGNSEHGPRALGNRSILCDPSYPKMKDILNSKVKFREWFRPFAPVIRKEKTSKYFEFNGESKFMSFALVVKENMRDKIPAVVHKDNTARLQTVGEDDNKFLYDLLEEFEKNTGKEVLLNTSFNIKGKPILTTIEDALDVLNNTELDAVLVEDYLFEK